MRGDQRPRATDCLTSEEARKASPSVVKRNSSSLGPAARAPARVSCHDQLRPCMQPLGCDCEVSGCSGQPFSSTSRGLCPLSQASLSRTGRFLWLQKAAEWGHVVFSFCLQAALSCSYQQGLWGQTYLDLILVLPRATM